MNKFTKTAVFLLLTVLIVKSLPALNGWAEELFAIEISSPAVGQGQTLAVGLYAKSATAGIKAYFMDRLVPFFKEESGPAGINYYQCFLGVPLDSEPGNAELVIKLEGLSEKNKQVVKQITVLPGAYGREILQLPANRVPLLGKQLQKESKQLQRIFAQLSKKKLWAGKFIQPLSDKRISSSFGVWRIYEQAKKESRHQGVDFAAARGEKVFSANRGKIVFSRYLKANGNTVIIDHGQGLFTVYIHLDKRKVKEGQIVNKGQLVATVGDTGIATAPNLHWGMKLHQESIDPLEWASRDFSPKRQTP